MSSRLGQNRPHSPPIALDDCSGEVCCKARIARLEISEVHLGRMKEETRRKSQGTSLKTGHAEPLNHALNDHVVAFARWRSSRSCSMLKMRGALISVLPAVNLEVQAVKITSAQGNCKCMASVGFPAVSPQHTQPKWAG